MDYVYVLYKCSSLRLQNKKSLDILKYLNFYTINIYVFVFWLISLKILLWYSNTQGKNLLDIHGTILFKAIVMILEIFEKIYNYKYKVNL